LPRAGEVPRLRRCTVGRQCESCWDLNDEHKLRRSSYTGCIRIAGTM